MANTHRWKWIQSGSGSGAAGTVKATNGAAALGTTYAPVVMTSNLLVTPAADGAAVWGVAIPKAAVSDTNVPVIVSNDIFEVKVTGDLNIGDAVMIGMNGGVLALAGTGAVACGTVVNYNPASDGIAHIKAKLAPNNTQQAGT